MFQVTEPVTLGIVAGIFGAAMGGVGALAKWGIASLESRKNGKDPEHRPGGFRSEDHLVLAQTHHAAQSADRRVQELAVAINGKLQAILEVSQRQVVGINEMACEFREMRLEAAKESGRRRLDG